MTIEEMVESSELKLRNYNSSHINAGNRPCYPMFIIYNNPENSKRIGVRLERFWPAAYTRLMQAHYTTDSALIDINENTNFNIDANVNAVKGTSGIFSKMVSLCIYNIVDTSIFSSPQDFLGCFDTVQKVKQSVENAFSLRSILIVLLDQSSGHEKDSTEIRQLLHTLLYNETRSDYDAVYILSNLHRDNTLVTPEEQCQAVADVLILSNNDDPRLVNRCNIMYEPGGVFTVSWQLRERPYADITFQLYDAIWKNLASSYNPAPYSESMRWESLLPSDMLDIERKDDSFYDGLPLKSVPEPGANPPRQISKMSFNEYSKVGFPDMVEALAEELTGADYDIVYDQLKKKVYETSPSDLKNLKFEDLSSSRLPNGDTPLPQYVVEYSEAMARKKLEDTCRSYQRRASDTSQLLRDALHNLLRICAGRNPLGSLYEKMVKSFFDQYPKRVSELALSQRQDNLIKNTHMIFDEILNINNDIFSSSFAVEWSKRLDQVGAEIYLLLKNDLMNEVNNKILLGGSYVCADQPMSVYMLDSENETGGLYTSFKTAFNGMDSVSFLDTGDPDMLEAVTLIRLSGNDSSNIIL